MKAKQLKFYGVTFELDESVLRILFPEGRDDWALTIAEAKRLQKWIADNLPRPR